MSEQGHSQTFIWVGSLDVMVDLLCSVAWESGECHRKNFEIHAKQTEKLNLATLQSLKF